MTGSRGTPTVIARLTWTEEDPDPSLPWAERVDAVDPRHNSWTRPGTPLTEAR